MTGVRHVHDTWSPPFNVNKTAFVLSELDARFAEASFVGLAVRCATVKRNSSHEPNGQRRRYFSFKVSFTTVIMTFLIEGWFTSCQPALHAKRPKTHYAQTSSPYVQCNRANTLDMSRYVITRWLLYLKWGFAEGILCRIFRQTSG